MTYADSSQGHTGAIYRASNWEYRGSTVKTDQWLDGDGNFVSRKAGKKNYSRQEMIDRGYTLKGMFSKERFRYVMIGAVKEAVQ